jgi:hypothetical protein
MADSRINNLASENTLAGTNTIPIDKVTYTDAKKTTLYDVKNYCNDNLDIVLDDILNVDAASANANDILVFDGWEWVAVANTSGGGGMTSWDVIADGGTAFPITDGQDVEFIAGTDISITGAALANGRGIEINYTGTGGGTTISSLRWKLSNSSYFNPASTYFSVNSADADALSAIKLNFFGFDYSSNSLSGFLNDIVGVGTYVRIYNDAGEQAIYKTTIATPGTYYILTLTHISGGFQFVDNEIYTFEFDNAIGGGGIPEAPTGSGVSYVRKNSTWVDLNSINVIEMLMDDIVNVDTAGVSDGDVLTYNSGNWEDTTLNIPTELDNLTDVNMGTGANNGDVLAYNSSTLDFEPVAPTGGGGIGEAPVNSNSYARNNAGWVETLDTFGVSSTDSSNSATINDGESLGFGGGADNIELNLVIISANEQKIEAQLNDVGYTNGFTFIGDGTTKIFSPGLIPSYVTNKNKPIAMLYENSSGNSLLMDGRDIWIDGSGLVFTIEFNSAPANHKSYYLRYTL